MLFFLGNRAATRDVDIIPLDFPDTTSPNRETKVFRSAVNAIAKAFRLRRDWMNDVVAAFTPPLPAESLVLWRDSPNLQKAERESPGHCMPGMNRRSFKSGEGNAVTQGLTGNARAVILGTYILKRS